MSNLKQVLVTASVSVYKGLCECMCPLKSNTPKSVLQQQEQQANKQQQ